MVIEEKIEENLKLKLKVGSCQRRSYEVVVSLMWRGSGVILYIYIIYLYYMLVDEDDDVTAKSTTPPSVRKVVVLWSVVIINIIIIIINYNYCVHYIIAVSSLCYD